MTHSYGNLKDFTIYLRSAQIYMMENIKPALVEEIELIKKKVIERVQSTGVSSDNTPFSTPYSKSHIWKKKKYGKGTYGKTTDVRNFTFRDKMWKNFGVRGSRWKGKIVSATLGFAGTATPFWGGSTISYKELNVKHSTKEGKPIGMLNEEECRELTRNLGLRIAKLIDFNL